MNGDTSSGPSVVGPQGQFSPAYHPHSTYERASWRDKQGNPWYLSNGDSLWKYDISINQWAWIKGSGNAANFGIKGVSAPTNTPGYRSFCSMTWVDTAGDFWLFGGYLLGGFYTDMWRYQISTNEWTWMNGSNISNDPGVFGVQGIPSPLNYPSGRGENNAAWVDSSSDLLWFFGGQTVPSYFGTNDVWRYDIVSNEWTWMKGDTLHVTPKYYVAKGIADPLNCPGSRATYCKWQDSNGLFWIFGGWNLTFPYYNDSWKYDYLTNNWTCVNPGTSSAFATGVCVEDTLNVPDRATENKSCWKDNCGNFWTFFSSNNLWKLNPNTGNWVLTKGYYNISLVHQYGTMGVPDTANNAQFNTGLEGWTDNDGNFWYYANCSMFKFVPDSFCSSCSPPSAVVSMFNTDSANICPGSCISFTNQSSNATNFQWTFSGGTPATSSDVTPQNICYASPGTYDVQLIASNSNTSDSLLMQGYITVYPFPAPQGITQTGDTLFANAGATNYQWYYAGNLIPGATAYFYVATQNGDYNVLVGDSNGCEVEAVIYDVITSVVNSSIHSSGIQVFPNPGKDVLYAMCTKSIEPDEFVIYNVLGEAVRRIADPVKVSDGLFEVNIEGLPKGVYLLKVTSGHQVFRISFVHD